MGMSDEYAQKISKRISFVNAIRTTLWVFCIFASIAGMVAVALGAIGTVFAIGIGVDALVLPLDNAQSILLQSAETIDIIRSDESYLEATAHVSEALIDMSFSTNQIATNLLQLSSNPLAQISLGSFGESVQNMKNATAKMQTASESIDAGNANIEQAFLELETVGQSLKSGAKSINNLKNTIKNVELILQICVILFALSLELFFSSILLLAFAYGIPTNIHNKHQDGNMSVEQKTSAIKDEKLQEKNADKIGIEDQQKKKKQQKVKNEDKPTFEKPKAQLLVMPKTDE